MATVESSLPDKVRVQAYVSPECAARLTVRARREGRSVSAMAARILHDALGDGEVLASEVAAVTQGKVPSVDRDDRGAVGRVLDRDTDGKSRSRDCTQFVPVGVKCKVCQKVHTPKGAK